MRKREKDGEQGGRDGEREVESAGGGGLCEAAEVQCFSRSEQPRQAH